MTETIAERSWTDAQRTAIAARTRTLVAAAAGSGKTSVLTELVVGALIARELAPSEVCAVTFTEKAAQEMRGRIASGLVARGEVQLAAELELARIGTIHSLCAAILRGHGAAVGVDPAAGVLDEAQSAWLQRAAMQDVLDAGNDADLHWLRSRLGDDRLRTLLQELAHLGAGSDGELQFLDADALTMPVDAKRGEPLADPADARRAHRAMVGAWRRFDAAVRARRRAVGMFAFDDLEQLAVEAVRVPEVRTALRARWTLVLVDEFQDTNARQFELLDAIGADRLFMVGDEWQSIYRFRGADVDVFRARRRDPANTVLPMRENFRSSAPVLDVVNRIFAHESLFGDGYEPVLPGTDAQRRAVGPAVELLVTPDDGTDVTGDDAGPRGRPREARRVAERIADLIESGAAKPGDIAVLYARGTGVDEYETALRAWGLPVLRGASTGYYDQRDVRDALSVLAAIRNGRDDHAALSVLAGPLGRLEWHELDALATAARQQETRLLAAACVSSLPGAVRVAAVIDQLASFAQTASLVSLVDRLVTLPEFELGAASAEDGIRRVANLRRLVELAASAGQVGVGSVAGFLEFVAAQQRDARVGEAALADEASGAVRLMTIHASKGLEFPHVFVIEAGSADAPRSSPVPSPRCDADGIVHLPVPCLDGRLRRAAAHEALETLDREVDGEERWRLWYVAMTRARSGLYVSARWKFEPTSKGAPRSMPGTLGWLARALDLDPFLGGAGVTSSALDGLVVVDTSLPQRAPRTIWQEATRHMALAVPELASEAVEPRMPVQVVEERQRLREALRSGVVAAREDEWRQLDGTRIHDAVARLLDAARRGVVGDALLDPERGPWLTDAARERLRPVVASDVFQRLVACSARTEVPYVAGRGGTVESRVAPGVSVAARLGEVDAGRIDALAQLDDGSWWIVDWKTTLPAERDAAWSEHGSQLLRYAATAFGAGATAARVTLVPLDRPDEPLTWLVDANGAHVAAP